MGYFLIMDPENSGETVQLPIEDKIKNDASHPKTQPFECILVKQEKFEEDQLEATASTGNLMFDYVYVKQEFPEDDKEAAVRVAEQACIFGNNIHQQLSHPPTETDNVDQLSSGTKTTIKTEEDPLAVAGDAISLRLVPCTHVNFVKSSGGPEMLSQLALHSNGPRFPGDTECFDDSSYTKSFILNNSTGLRSPELGTEEEVEKFCCSSCPAVFKSKYSLIKHVSVHMDSTHLAPYMCELCGEVLDYEEQLAEHVVEVHTSRVVISDNSNADDNPLVTDYCATVFNEQEPYDDYEGSTPLDMFKCAIRQSCEIKSSVVQTIKSAGRCNLCTKLFKNSHDLNNHICINGSELRRRLTAPRRPCQGDCSSPDSVETSNWLPVTKVRIQQRVQKMYPCDLCSKSFPKPCQLNYHMRSHTGERPYECTICGKTFLKLAHLNVHNRSHTGEKPFSCDICGKSFPESCKLSRHMLSHSRDKPFVCNICGKSYSSSSSLSCHKRLHTGRKLSKCDVCDKSFVRPSVLQVHLRTHTGEKPHKCHMCEKSFTQIGNLKRHIQCHMDGKLTV